MCQKLPHNANTLSLEWENRHFLYQIDRMEQFQIESSIGSNNFIAFFLRVQEIGF